MDGTNRKRPTCLRQLEDPGNHIPSPYRALQLRAPPSCQKGLSVDFDQPCFDSSLEGLDHTHHHYYNSSRTMHSIAASAPGQMWDFHTHSCALKVFRWIIVVQILEILAAKSFDSQHFWRFSLEGSPLLKDRVVRRKFDL